MDSPMIAGLIGIGFSCCFALASGYAIGRRLRRDWICKLRRERDEAKRLAEWTIFRRMEDQRYFLALNLALQERATRAEKAIAEAGMVLAEDVGGEVSLRYETEAPLF